MPTVLPTTAPPPKSVDAPNLATAEPPRPTLAAAAAASGPTQPAAEAFIRPNVAPLPASGKFQVVSQDPWPGDKVRVFFLGAQF
jgi:hypothetical protein